MDLKSLHLQLPRQIDQKRHFLSVSSIGALVYFRQETLLCLIITYDTLAQYLLGTV